MRSDFFPTLTGKSLFRENELVYVNRSDELKQYNGIMHKHDFVNCLCYSGKGLHVVGDQKLSTKR